MRHFPGCQGNAQCQQFDRLSLLCWTVRKRCRNSAQSSGFESPTNSALSLNRTSSTEMHNLFDRNATYSTKSSCIYVATTKCGSTLRSLDQKSRAQLTYIRCVCTHPQYAIGHSCTHCRLYSELCVLLSQLDALDCYLFLLHMHYSLYITQHTHTHTQHTHTHTQHAHTHTGLEGFGRPPWLWRVHTDL